MNNIQENLTTIKDTINDLKSTINEIAIVNGSNEVISDCTSFENYPEILRSVSLNASSGIATIFAYKISDIDPGSPGSDGYFDFNTNTYSVPENWNTADELNAGENDTVWMTHAIFAKNANTHNNIVDSWSKPIRISTFSNPIIQDVTQSVYLNTSTDDTPQKPFAGNNDISLNADSIAIGWSENYSGLTINKPYGWISSRKRTNGIWSNYSTPVLYSYYSKDGKDGESGIINRLAFAFISTSSKDIIPSTPVGGTWDLSSNDVILPYGWTQDPMTDTTNKYVWMSTALFTTSILKNPQWSSPVCITGDDGIAGADGVNSEFIYAQLPSQDDFNIFKTYLDEKGFSLEISDTNTVPNFILSGSHRGTSIIVPRSDKTEFTVQLTDSPNGINEKSHKVEIYWTRNRIDDKWSNWIGPMYWSVWGENGMDGDGIEYIFTASNDPYCDTPLPVYADLLANDPAEAQRFQEREYVPEGWFDNDESNGNWSGCGPDAPYLFCSSRKQFTNDLGVQLWGDFTTPKIWGHYGMDGRGSYTSFAFCISKADLSKYKVIGGKYGDALNGLTTYDSSNNIVNVIWTDTITRDPNFDETIWMINKFFNGSTEETSIEWFGPVKMTDSEHFQVEFNCPSTSDSKSRYDGRDLISLEEFKELQANRVPSIIFDSISDLEQAWREYVYDQGCGYWTDNGKNAEYMATARFVDNKWEPWSINKIKGESGDVSQFVFTLTDGRIPDNPTPTDISGDYQNDNYRPAGWSHNPVSVSDDEPICWVSKRDRKNGIWGAYSSPAKWAMYAIGNVHVELSEDNVTIPIEINGVVDTDYNDFIEVKISLYDNGNLINNDEITYSAIINGDSDSEINQVFDAKPTNTITAGFFGNSLYIGRDYINRWSSVSKLRVECQIKYKDVLYTKTFVINKSTNAYEMQTSQDVIYIDNFGNVKTSDIRVKILKWMENSFNAHGSGYLDWVISYRDDIPNTTGNMKVLSAESIIPLSSYKNIESITINYRLEQHSEIITYEVIGSVIDGKDGESPVSQFVANVFCRTNENLAYELYAPSGGIYDNPLLGLTSLKIPDKFDRNKETTLYTFWSDGIPEYDSNQPKQIWMSSKIFYSDNSQNDKWSIPVLIQDTADTDIWWNDSEILDLPNPGDISPDAITSGNWYDGDSKDTQITHNPYWMATRKQVNGSWSEWVVTKVKGEKGEKGDPGENGANGDIGPMMRFSVWGVNAPDTKYYSRDFASANNYDWYDVVEYNKCYYLCKETHEVVLSPVPGTNDSIWEKSSHYDFITANTAAIEEIAAKKIFSEKISAEELTTYNPDGSQIKIQDGLFAAYKDVTKHPNLVIGVNDAGEVVLQIYNDNGILLWDLGKDGLQNRFQNTTSTVQNFNSSFDYGLYLNSNNMFDEKGKYSDEFLDDVKKYNWANTNVLKIYQYVNVTETTTTVNGQTTTQVTEGPDHNKYFKGSNVASGYANGIYLSNRQQYPAHTTLTDAVKNSINNFNNSVGHEPYMIQVDDTNNFTIYYCKFLYIVNGNVERSETIYWR